MADAISIQEVRHVAELARLAVTDDHARTLAHELSTILDHMQVLSAVNAAGVPEYVAANAAMRCRDDHGPPVPLEEPPAAFAPEMRDGFFVVPRLASHEDPDSAP